MWIEINQGNFDINFSGFTETEHERGALYTSPGLGNIETIHDLIDAEYGVAVYVDKLSRRVDFGRDYLGHYPLLYALGNDSIFISHDFNTIVAWLKREGISLTVSEESLALYFVMGYVPQGRTLYEQVKTCNNTSLYHWKDGKVREEDVFSPIDVDHKIGIHDLRDCLEREIARQAAANEDVDVWCSGGLDSCIVAHLMNTNGRTANLLSLDFDDYTKQNSGPGEYHFAQELADSLGLSLRSVILTPEYYLQRYFDFVSQHLSPVIDLVVPPKYALSHATYRVAITGEGGDPLFSGVKNNGFLFSLSVNPGEDVGWLYAKAHSRSHGALEKFFTRGDELRCFVSEYFRKQFDKYPGDYVRKLLYINAIEKQGGMIFPKNYYAGKAYGVKTIHPITSLNMYKLAFSMRDDMKYRYPNGKLALIEAYKSELPSFVTTRKKSGTRVPLNDFIDMLAPNGLQMNALEEIECLDQRALQVHNEVSRELPQNNDDILLQYGLVTLENWLSTSIGGNYASNLSYTSRYMQ